MEQQRLVLVAILAILSFLLYMDWQKDFGPKPVPPVTQSASQSASAPVTTGTDEQAMPVPPSMPSASASSKPQTTTPKPASVAIAVKKTHGKEIVVDSDVYHVVIDSQGGDIRELDLKKYPVAVDKPHDPYRLLEETRQRLFVAQSGFFASNSKQPADLTPTRQTVYQTSKDKYVVTKGATNVDLSWTNRDGIKFIIRYTFMPNTYHIKVSHIVDNPTADSWQGSVYMRLERTPGEKHKGITHLPTYVGPVYYSPAEKYKKVKFSEIDDANPKNSTPHDAIDQDFTGGWAAVIEHYFVGAWIPPKKAVYRYFTGKPGDDLYLIGMISHVHTVKPHSNLQVNSNLFVGPKLYKSLAKVAPGLDLTVDYGWTTFISRPLFIILSWIHGIVGNWGWAIILLTLAIKLVFYKLSETSYKSMANMRKLQPRLKTLKERYGDDKQKYQQAMMEVYKKEKINPLGGCLPIVIQIPVFIALYYMLLESVELRQAPWIFWIKDLSVRDPYFVLPIIMGITSLLQTRLNPTPVDPMQAKMMMVLPIVFTALFMFFPSGLVLYYVVNNILSIAQQWYITRVVIKDSKPKPGS